MKTYIRIIPPTRIAYTKSIYLITLMSQMTRNPVPPLSTLYLKILIAVFT